MSNLLASFAYWVVAQNPNKYLIDIRLPLQAFERHMAPAFKGLLLEPAKFKYQELRDMINEKEFGKIPEILALNEMKPDFIDLGALARNVFYMILREHITQN